MRRWKNVRGGTTFIATGNKWQKINHAICGLLNSNADYFNIVHHGINGEGNLRDAFRWYSRPPNERRPNSRMVDTKFFRIRYELFQ